ncbi:hypothetical protein QCB45_08290 [Thiomicrorhabdus sp. ZW0627]|uniref:hypothetical protein n=1 Tax=Thiomicrorhabdus sp. ZW0627 TaxID=3039774 RepID=UPI002436D882|nr:hypothetical protein [Thiomicrorhabdus sp. ZW0627]MDG6774329.1 hypothetical protein [Thiomicrorhabdus sp. ZW0627]
MKKLQLAIITLSTSALVACGGTPTKPANNSSTAQSIANSDKVTTLSVPRIIPISKNRGPFSQAALSECTLPTQYTELLFAHANDNGINVEVVDSQEPTKQGYFLLPSFTQIRSSGNAFIGHNKYTEMHLTLYKDGKKVSEADFGRVSGGGLFGGYKGSCSVLGRTVEANAEDTVLWLNSPVDGARFGDLN